MIDRLFLVFFVLMMAYMGAAMGEYRHWQETGIHTMPKWARVNP